MTPRLVTASAAAKYLGVSESYFRSKIEPIVRPLPLDGVKRFDIKALDRWLDEMSSLPAESPVSPGGAFEAREQRKRCARET